MKSLIAESHTVRSELRLRQVIDHDQQPFGPDGIEDCAFSLPDDFEPALPNNSTLVGYPGTVLV